MSLRHGSSVVKNGLVLHLDARNVKANPNQTNNLLAHHTWCKGSGTYVNRFYPNNGLATENERIISTDPFNRSAVIWQSPSNDALSNDDGGWNSSRVPVDNTKMYRFSVWIRKRNVIGDGRAYLGTYAYNSANTALGVKLRSSTTTSANFYFAAYRFDTDLAGTALDQWLLFVGHVWPVDSGEGADHVDTGIYNMSGQKVRVAFDCTWLADTTQTMHRSYQYYSTNISEIQQWWDPRIDLVDGNEPTIADLLAGRRDYKLDLTNNVRVGIKPSVLQSQTEYVVGTAESEITVDASAVDFTNEQTIIQILKPTSTAVCNPYEQAYGGFGTITKNTDGTFTYFHGSSGINALPYTGIGSVFTVAVNETAYIAVTRDADPTNGIKWYKNGVLVRSAANNYAANTVNYLNHIVVGNGYAGTWPGSIYTTLVYNRALSAAEIRQNFEAMRGRYNI